MRVFQEEEEEERNGEELGGRRGPVLEVTLPQFATFALRVEMHGSRGPVAYVASATLPHSASSWHPFPALGVAVLGHGHISRKMWRKYICENL